MLETVSKKILLKYCKWILSEDEIKTIIANAAHTWLSENPELRSCGPLFEIVPRVV